jgi:flagellar hook-associated protein 3 FlgL
MNDQFSTNRQNARSSLSSVEQALGDGTDLLVNVQTLVVQAGNGVLSQSDRGMVATELEGRLQDLMGVANTADGAGGYLFSGYHVSTQPFLQTASGANYQGDQGQRVLQVGSARHMAISDTGNAVFENIRTGNGTFSALPAGGNVGTGVVESTAVTDSTQLGHAYELKFSVSGTPAATSYTVTDTSTTPASAVQGGAYAPGQQIAFKGMALAISGAPADGDTFTVAPSPRQSVFTTITDLINVLRAPADTAQQKAVLSNGLNEASGNLKNALDNMLTVRASVGSRLKELDYLDNTGDDLKVQYAGTLSDLQDLDVAKAMSTFSQQQLALEAAQKSFKAVSSLSLFNYI